MNRITAALYRFLVVYLSVAMVVTSIPLAPSTAYADDTEALAVENEAQETDSDSDADAKASYSASSSDEGSSSTSSDQTNNAQDKSSSSDTSTSTSSLAQDLSSSATDSDAAKTSPATAEPPSDDSEADALTYEPTVYEYAKFMPNYYLYPCDADGNVTVEIDENNPSENSVDGRMVTNLIIDYRTNLVDVQLCADSTNLRSVLFENSSISKIGTHAFYNCPNLTDISLSGMIIGAIGKEAFFGCKSLTSLNINEATSIGSMGEAAFAESGLESTGLDKVVGLTSIPDRAYDGCKALTDTGLDKNTSITSIGVCAFRHCSSLATTGLESNTTVETLGHTCFYGTGLSGGLTLPYNSKIEELPKKAFYDTNLETVFLGCNHVVLIDTDTFPKYNMTVMVPAKMISKYSKGEPKQVWESCNGCLPVPVGKVLQGIEISRDPDKMAYQPGEKISLEGMSVSFQYPHSLTISDYESLLTREMGEYLTATPCDGDVFDGSMDGEPIQLVYDDGYTRLVTYSKGNLQQAAYEYAKLMPNYYLYPCDADGNLTVEIDENNPRENSVDGRMVTNLIVDYGVDEVDAQLCADSTNLRSVRFENSSISKIGLHAFYNCPNLTDISLSGMTIGTIGKEAFYGCKSLTSLNISETATIGSMGEAAFAGSGLVSTGLDKIVGLTSIPDRAYDGCKALTDTGLDKNTSITSVGVCAFRHCSSLATTGLESNTTVETLGHTCFYGTDLSGGLTLPYNSKIEELPDKAFYDTNLETVFLACDHAVLINTDTFPKYNMTVMVPARMISKYANGHPKAVWERCNGCLPVPVGKVLKNVEISCDPNNMTYETGETISLEGMNIELDYPHSVSIWDYEALIQEELGEYLTATPRDGDVFDESMDGQPVKLVYDDGYSHFETQTKGTLQLKKPTPTSFQISYAQKIDKGERKLMDGVELPDVSGTITIDAGAEVTLDAGALGMLNDNITFKGWYDTESGKYISKEPVYTFTPDKDLSLEARFKLKDYAVHINDAQATDSSQDFAHLSVTAQNCYRNAGETVDLSAATDNALFLGWYLGEGDDAYAVSDQLDFTYTVDKADAIVSEDKTDARIEITPRYCAPQASVVLSVDGVDENGQPLGQFLSTGLYGIGSRVTVVAVPMPGYVFDYATDALGNVVFTGDDGPSYTFVLEGDVQYTAHFREANGPDESLVALKAALIAAITAAAVLATMYGLGEIVDPIAADAVIEIGMADNIEDVAVVGTKVLKEIKDIIDDHKKPKPHGDHKIEIIATAQPEVGGVVTGGGIHYEGTVATLEAVANPGYRFVCWKEDGVEVSTSPLKTMTITKATPEVVKMTAVFEKKVEITAVAEADGIQADFSTGCTASPVTQSITRGDQAMVTASEGPDYAFVGWFEDGIEVSPERTYIFKAEVDRHLVARFRKADKTILVNTDPFDSAEVLCDGVPVVDGEVRAKDGDILTFTMRPKVRPDNPEKTYRFVEWRETDAQGITIANKQEVCEYRVNGNARIEAVMDGRDTHTVRAEADPLEGGTVTLKRGETAGMVLEVPEGERVTAEATPSEGYIFDGWYLSNGGSDATSTLVSSERSYTFEPIIDCVIQAKFTRACKVGVVVEPAAAMAGKYLVHGEGYCIKGDPATLSIELTTEASKQFTFKGWYDAKTDLLLGTDPSYLEFYPEDVECTVRAVFEENTYTVAAKAKKTFVERGTVEIEGHPGASSVTCGYGDTVILKAKANDGYRFDHWKDDSGKEYATAELVVKVTKSDTYTAIFTDSKPEVMVTADSWLGGTVTCNGTVVKPTTDKFKLGETLHLTAKAHPGFLFRGWYVNGRLKSLKHETTLVAKARGKTGHCVITAAFVPIDTVCVPLADPAEGGTVKASRILADRGAEVALKATPNPGYVFTGWYTADGTFESADAEFTCHQERSHVHVARFMAKSYEVDATTVVDSDTGSLVESSAAGWVEGTGTVEAGHAATLTAHALSGYAFEYWADASGAVVSRDTTYHVVPTSDMTLQAVFSAKQFTVDVSCEESMGTVKGAGTYAAGQVVTVRAIAAEDTAFVGWFRNGTCVSSKKTYRFTVREDTSLYAVFASGSYVVSTVASPAEGGAVSGFGGYESGDRATLRAIASTGYSFAGWTDDKGETVSENADYTVKVTGDATYTATFTPQSYQVVLSASDDGVGILSGEGSYQFGDTVELNATSMGTKRFVGWYVLDTEGNKSLLSCDAHCWVKLDKDMVEGLEDDTLDIQAVFADPYEVTVSGEVVVKDKASSRGCRVTGSGSFAVGDQVELTAVAGMGYRFVGWSTDKEGTSIVETATTLDVTATQDMTYYAQFESDGQVTITVTGSSIFRGTALLVDGIPAGSRSYDRGDMYMAIAIPWKKYHFSHWVDDAGVTVSYSAFYIGTAKENRQLTAVFYETGCDVQVATYPKGAGFSMVALGTGSSYHSAAIMFTVPHKGWKFKYWVDENGLPVGFTPVINRVVFGNRTFTAVYERASMTVTAVDSRQGGHVEGSSEDESLGYAVTNEVENGESTTLTAVPDAGYVFDGWYTRNDDGSLGDEPLSTDAVRTFVPEDNMTVEARFAEAPRYKVTAQAVNGSVDPETASVATDGKVTLSATPDEGCYLTRVTVAEKAGEDGSVGNAYDLDISDYQGGAYEVTLSGVSAPQQVTFEFAKAAAPKVLAQPQDASAYEGDPVELSVAAEAGRNVRAHAAVSSGSAADVMLSYQWYRVTADGGKSVALKGETGETLSIAQLDSEGEYFCRITQSYLGTVTKTDTKHATVSIVPREALVFNGRVLPAATAHDEYRAEIAGATGGKAPYAYNLDEVEVSEGMQLTQVDDGSGALVLSGAPSATGVCHFKIRCTDDLGDKRVAHFALVVKAKEAPLAFEGHAFTYNATAQAPELSGVPEGCEGDVAVTYVGTGDTFYSSDKAPVDAGTYRAVATLDANGYVGNASCDFTIEKAPVDISIETSDVTYDGARHGAAVAVAGLDASAYSVTYRGVDGTSYGPTALGPCDSGNYRVTVKVTDPNYQGKQSAEFSIAKASQVITGTTSYSGVYGGDPIVFNNVAQTPVSFELVDSDDDASPVSIKGRCATVKAAGTARIVAHAKASRNYLAAEDVGLSVSVAPAQLLVKVDDADRFEGQENPEFTSSLVSRCDTSDVKVTYFCSANKKSPAGEYQIDAAVADPNFDVAVDPGTLTVKKKPEHYKVTTKAVNGSVDNALVSVVEGGDATLSAMPDEDCYLERVTVTEAGSDATVDLDISDYKGGAYEVTLSDVTASQEVTFEFAKADAPRVVAQPQDVSVHEGDSAVLSVAAEAGKNVDDHAASSTGCAAEIELSYQWFRMVDGEAVALEGETGETLSLADLDGEQAGEYFCRITQHYLGIEKQTDSDCASVSIVPWDTLVFNGDLLPAASTHSTYLATIARATGGKAPYEYAWDETKLPDGLKLSRTSGGLTLSGVPSKTGVSAFDITCTDARGEAMTARFALVVQAKHVKLSFTDGDFTFNGASQAPEVSGAPKVCKGDLRVWYLGTGSTQYSSTEAPTDAGTYRAVAMLRSHGYIGAAACEFEIAPTKLKVKVDDAERFEGEANPAFTSSLESAVDTLGVKVEYSCDADESSPAGEYQIGATVTDPNFDVEVVPGTLTVKKKQEPVDPGPDNPDPDQPDPGPNPDPDNPDPGNPDPDQPDPNPDNPDPDKPDPDNPDKPERFEVTAKAVNGSVDNASVTVDSGGDVTLSAMPDEDCYLERVTVTEAGSDKAIDLDISGYEGGAYEVTLSGVTASHEITFEFAKADAPKVIAQPQDANAHEGDAVVLSVAAEAGKGVLDHASSSTGSAAVVELSYQWFHMVGGEAVALGGETGETLLIENLDDYCAGEYFCRVTQRYLGTETQVESDRAVVSVVPRDALVFNGGLLPVARAHSTYRATISGAAGGEAPYEYTWDDAKLPDGFKLTRTAGGLTLSGTPSKVGVSTFDITCKDAQGKTVTAHFVLVVQAKRVELAFEGGNFVYSGDAQAPKVTGVPKACEGDLRVRYYGTGGTHYSSSEAPTDAGTYRAVATLRSDGYISAASRKFKISPAKLKVKVDDVERFEGEMNPAFTSSLKSSADTSGVKVEYSCVADESSPAGEYQIGATVTDPNFDVVVEPGTLTVKKKQEPVGPDPVEPSPDKPDGPDPGNPDKPEPDKPEPDKPEPDQPDQPEPDKPGSPDSDQSDSKDPAKPGSSDDSAADKTKANGAENSGKKASSRTSAQQLADTGDKAPLAVAVAAGAVALIALGFELLRRRHPGA
ncbi:leucine-rich repeat protein [Collinsella aerofaciens]|uniref:InlB B-repeat-containing protein n=1 Tax=Collinsella aerofaciens TaxID=74426 RepID=UPI00290E94C7|nr:leucine-rich repeat protein [Collinsella aerofaciens]MDU8577318.1 leucine-rich repeat protein [Collinsella aerofaciens]